MLITVNMTLPIVIWINRLPGTIKEKANDDAIDSNMVRINPLFHMIKSLPIDNWRAKPSNKIYYLPNSHFL